MFGAIMLVFVACFASSWGVAVWATACELVPLRWHANGISLAVCALWCTNAFVAWLSAKTPMLLLKWVRCRGKLYFK